MWYLTFFSYVVLFQWQCDLKNNSKWKIAIKKPISQHGSMKIIMTSHVWSYNDKCDYQAHAEIAADDNP